MWTVISGIFGGVLRLAPELFKFMDAKNERKHELDMQDKAIEFQKLKGNQRIEEIGAQGNADWDKGALDALKEAIKDQAVPSGIKWIDGLSKLIRPLVALEWLVLLYPGIIIATFCLAVQSGIPVLTAMTQSFGTEEKAMVAFILDFYFIGRILDRGREGRVSK